MKAVIPAAGLGTRFLPATKAQPKEMLPVVDKPAIQYVVEEAVESGIEDILIITGRGKRAIEDHFDKSVELEGYLWSKDKMEELRTVQQISEMARIFYVRQSEPLGLGHAVLCAKEYVNDDDFAVLLGDDIVVADTPCTKQLATVFKKRGRPVVAVEEITSSEAHLYGIVSGKEIDEDLFVIEDITEKPPKGKAKSSLASMGRYFFSPAIFEYLEKTKPDARGEIQLTDAIGLMAKEEEVLALRYTGRRFDIGSNLGWIVANIELALGRKEVGPKLRDYLRKVELG
ncbi:MAG: UTP--glucose-1-phosphate uridylyltransferase GalU [Thermoplasmata archaeon]